MKAQCIMCGRAIAQGIVCESCDKPRKNSSRTARVAALPPTAPPLAATLPVPFPAASPTPPPARPSPVSPAPTAPPQPSPSVNEWRIGAEALEGAGVAVLAIHDKQIEFASREARRLFGSAEAVASLGNLQKRLGSNLPDPTRRSEGTILLDGKPLACTIRPMDRGVSLFMFRELDQSAPAHASFVSYVRETVLLPLRALREALAATARSRKNDPLLDDAVSTVDQILSSLEMAPEVEEHELRETTPRLINDVLRSIEQRFGPVATAKGISFRIDSPDNQRLFNDHQQLESSLGALVENALHYVPGSGQIVVGLRFLEHKGKPLHLFFVMDNGPIVPEEFRTAIFTTEFLWKPAQKERTGRGLAACREFAVTHGGQIWVEAKSGKTCTFFIRLPLDA